MELTIEQALQQGVAAHKEGKLQDAERLYRAILQSQPAHPDANHNLGVLAVSANKADSALPLFKTALKANPKIEQFWLSYIDALIKELHFENAKQVLEQAKKQGVVGEKLNVLEAQLASISKQETVGSLSPSQQQLINLLKYYQNGRLDDAEKLAVSVTQEFPQHPSGWRVLGAVLEQTGRKSEALDANQILVALSPKDASAHSNLGVTLKELGRLEEAEESFTQAISLKPDFAEAHNNLGNLLKELGRFDEAEASYSQAIALKPDFAKAYNNFGSNLQELCRLDEAEASYTQAIILKSDYAEAHSNLGIALQELGRLEESEASCRQAIALKPDFAEAHYNLTKLKKFDAQDEQYLKMLELYLNEDISEEQRCYINFGLAKACEDLENFEQAFTHYGEGNVLRKKLLNYDINQDVELFKQLKSSYPKIEKNLLESDKLSKNLMPIFIVGMPRSGTTLVEQIISSHLQVTGAGELNFVKQFGSAIATGITEVNNEALLDFRHNYLDTVSYTHLTLPTILLV